MQSTHTAQNLVHAYNQCLVPPQLDMAGKRVSLANVDTEDNLTDGAEGAEAEKPEAKEEQKKRQKIRRGSRSKKKERTFNWPMKNLFEATYADSVTGIEVRCAGLISIHLWNILFYRF